MKIDFKDFTFIAKKDEDEYFVSGTETKLSADCTDWTPNTILKNGWGLFEGKTMVTYNNIYLDNYKQLKFNFNKNYVKIQNKTK